MDETAADDRPLFDMFDEVVGHEWPPIGDPDLAPVPAAFLRRVQEMSPTWRALGMGSTFLGYQPEEGRLWLAFGITDEHHRVHMADYRVDVTDTRWIAAQVHGCARDEPRLEDADPVDTDGRPITDPDPDSAAVAPLRWIETTLRRLLLRYHRRDGEQLVAGGTWSLSGWPSPDLMRSDEDGERARRGVWFPVYDDSLGEDAAWPGEDPPLTGAPAALLRALRARIRTWRALGIEPESTEARHGDQRLRLTIELVDPEMDALYGALRLDIAADEWQAGWVHPLAYGAPTFWEAGPLGETTGTILVADVGAGVAAAVEWLEAELHRPVVRHVWESDGTITSCWWDVDDGVVETIVSHPPYLPLDPATADRTTQMRGRGSGGPV